VEPVIPQNEPLIKVETNDIDKNQAQEESETKKPELIQFMKAEPENDNKEETDVVKSRYHVGIK
jgi:hypothetical protein